MTYREFQSIIAGSKSYEFDGTCLEITGYYTGQRVRLDLSRITEEMFEDIQSIVQNYRGYDIEKVDDGWIVDLGDDEVLCDDLEDAEMAIDYYLDGEE